MFWRQVLASESGGSEALKDAGHRNHFRLLAQEGQSWSGREPNVLWQNRGDNTFDEVGNVTGLATRLDSRGAATADLDNDGDLDLVVVNRNSPLVRVLRNNTPDQGNSLLVDLASPTTAVGAQAAVLCDGRVVMRQVEAGSGLLSQSSPTLHFGLGGCERVKDLEVRWPSGAVDTWHDLAANQRLTLREGQAATTTTALRARNYNAAEPVVAAGGISAEVPDVTYERLGSGEAVALRDMAAGGTTVLNHWATWCIPCRTEMPELVKVADDYADRGVHFVGVALDERGDEAAVQAFLTEFGVTYDQVWGTADSQAPFANLASAPNGSVPMTVVVHNGLVRWVRAGAVDAATLGAVLDGLEAAAP